MKRISNEEGIQAGARNIGRSALWSIPLLLGMAFSVWLGAFIQAHEFFHLLSQEQRMAIYVAPPDAPPKPKDHIQISVLRHDCSKVERVDLDGNSIIIYGKNTCNKQLDYFAYHWQEISQNGTVIGDGYENGCPIPRQPADVGECRTQIPNPDDRTKTVRVWVQQDIP